MATLGQIRQTLDESQSLKIIAQAYSEIAAVKLQKIRSNIERNRVFFQEISAVFRLVKVAAAKKNIHPRTKKEGVVSILVTSNHRFYGDLENQLTRFFVINTTKFATDRVVIGKTALEFLQTIRYSHPYQAVTFSEDLPQYSELNQLISNLMEYQQVLVYYPRMQSVLVQTPHVVDILQRPPENYLATTGRTFEYIFEPEIGQMLHFFDSQIATLLFEQTFLESELARTAARLISMEQAQDNADDYIKTQKRMLYYVQKSLDSSRLLDTIAALMTRRKDGYVW